MLRKLYYISPTNTIPMGRVFWGSLWVLHVINVRCTFVGPLAPGITFGKGTLKRIGKANKAHVFSAGCPPTPWVQVDSVLMNGWLPCAADGHNVQTTCCFLNGDHTVTL